jgi:acetyl esterase/lipase
MVFAADDEVLCGDANALVEAARRAGVQVEFERVGDSVYSFVLFDFLPEADEAIEKMRAFVRRSISPAALPDRVRA